MKRLLTPEQEDFLYRNAKGRMVKELTDLYNAEFDLKLTCEQVKNWKARNRAPSGLTRKEIAERSDHQKLFTDEQERFLIKHHKGINNKELRQLLTANFDTAVTVGQVKAFKQRNKLDSGLRGTEGIDPPNKGKKQSQYMPPEAIERTKATRFQKGQRSINHKPVGHERIDSKDGYVIIKTKEPNVYEHKHRVIWERACGPIPEGHKIIFLNGNPLDHRLENLAMVSGASHVRLNQSGLRFDDPELTRSGVAVADLMTEIGRAKRRRQKLD